MKNLNDFKSIVLASAVGAASLQSAGCADTEIPMAYRYDDEPTLIGDDAGLDSDVVDIGDDVGNDVRDVFPENDVTLPSDTSTFNDTNSTSDSVVPPCLRDLPADFIRAIEDSEQRMIRPFQNEAAAQSRIFPVDTGLYDTRLTDLYRLGANENEGMLAVTVLGSTDTDSRVSICTIEFNRATESYFDPNCFTFSVEGNDLTSDIRPISAWQITEAATQNDPRRRTYQMSFDYADGDVAGCDIKFEQVSQPEAGYRVNDVCDFVCTAVSAALVGRHQEFLQNHPDYNPGR